MGLTMSYYTRRMWGAQPRRRNPGTLDPRQVVGIALHWPGMSAPLRTVKDVKAALRAWQKYHQDVHGWSDIAYQVAVDQAGNRYRLRGLRYRSAANGNTNLNLRYAAALLVLAPGEVPSDEMIRAVRKVVRKHRRIFPHSHQIVGHGEIRPGGTDCPGQHAREMIAEDVFEPKAKGWAR